MVRKSVTMGCLFVVVLAVVYLLVWPVPIDPVAWQPPHDPGYTGVFSLNKALTAMETFSLGGRHGPEDVAVDDAGRIYVPTHEGEILRLSPDGSRPEVWANTGGRPLGMDFDNNGNLVVADAFLGLLSVDPTGRVTTLATIADGISILYADDVDVARDGMVYFSDASTKFGPRESGGTLEASLLDLMEHGGHGRLLEYDPRFRTAVTLVKGLNFANGVAVSHDQTYVLVNETGSYRVIRYWIKGPKQGQSEPFIEGLPAFPDNISTGLDDRFWIAMVTPRNPLLDRLGPYPFLRKVVQRIPKCLHPKPVVHGHVIAVNTRGQVVANLQDPDGAFPMTTGVVETGGSLYIGSLVAPALGRLDKGAISFTTQ
ncbi:MAG: strictosidine synthase family protein [Desulfobacteraceae bacterium]|nr:strictosidine synthase family protein [Desulfobacteraceae bacterium]